MMYADAGANAANCEANTETSRAATDVDILSDPRALVDHILTRLPATR